jgi:VWFA-related protein
LAIIGLIIAYTGPARACRCSQFEVVMRALSPCAGFAALVLAALVSGRVTAQAPRTFRTGVEAVVLDVSVLDRDRQPVRGLTAADFTILEDGRPQAIQTFSAIDVPAAVVAETSRWMREVLPDVRTNEEFKDGRVVVLVLDDATPMPAPDILRAKALARRTLEALEPHDLAAVVFALDRAAGQEFTHDRARLLASVEKFNGGIDGMPGPDRRGRGAVIGGAFDQFNGSAATLYQAAIHNLTTVAESLAALPERRKALVYVSVGVPLEFDAAAPLTVTDGTGDTGSITRQLIKELQEAFGAAQRANVAIYGLDPGGLRAPNEGGVRSADEANPGRMNREFLETLALNTGGFVVANTNEPGAGISQMFRENGSYYLAGYVPANTRADGRFRRIEVRVNRPGVTVRARTGYFEPRAARPGSAPAAKPSTLAAALDGIVPSPGLALQMTAAPFARADGRDADVAIVLGVRQSSRAGTAAVADEIEVLARAYDMQATSRGADRIVFRLGLRPGGDDDEVRYEVVSQLRLKPGRYQLRAAAHSSVLDASGSVFYDLDVPDVTGAGVFMSGVVLSVAPPPVSIPKGRLAALLPITPTAERTFGPADQVTAFLRVYQGGRSPLVSVPVAVRIVDSRDAVVFETTERLGPDRFASGRTADYRLSVPVAGLTPGPHLLTLEAGLGGTRPRRDVRFLVQAPARGQ